MPIDAEVHINLNQVAHFAGSQVVNFAHVRRGAESLGNCSYPRIVGRAINKAMEGFPAKISAQPSNHQVNNQRSNRTPAAQRAT